MSLEIVLFSFTNFQPPWSVADPWEGSRGACPPHPLIFRPNWGPKGWKNFFSRPPHTPPLFFLRVWMTRLPLTWRSGSATVSSETQGQIVGARIKYGTKKSKERREGPLGTMSCQTSSRLSPPFWLLIGARKTQVFWHQSEARTAATVLELVWWDIVPWGSSRCSLLFIVPYFSLAPTICPWVSEDAATVDLYLGCCWASTPTAHEGCMSLTADCRMVWSSFLGPWSLLLIQWWHSRNTWLDLTP